MANDNGIKTAPPHKIFAATLELARKSFDDELLGVIIWLVVQTKWKSEHARVIADEIDAFFGDPNWFSLTDEEPVGADEDLLVMLDQSQEVVMLNRAMVHLGEKACWHVGPPDPDWNNPDWEHESWNEPDVSIVNCSILVEQGKYADALAMLESMMEEPSLFFFSEEPDGTMTAFWGLGMTIDLHHDQAKEEDDQEAAAILAEMDDMVLSLVDDEGAGDEVAGD